jgi:transcriptional regulator with XRE-family HTH domain
VSSQLNRQIGANLKAARKSCGLTQTELGDRIGRDGFQISRWERGAHKPSDEALYALGEALGLDYFDFFREPEEAAA